MTRLLKCFIFMEARVTAISNYFLIINGEYFSLLRLEALQLGNVSYQ